MKIPVRSSLTMTLAAFLLSACQGDPTAPSELVAAKSVAATSGRDEVIDLPVDIVTFVPCALDGAGEDVALSGFLRITTKTTISAGGRATVRSQYSPRNIVGRGLTSGDTYHGNGVTINSFSFPVGKTEVTQNIFQVIGQGPGNNFRVHERIAVTVNANGTTTNVRIDSRFSCK